jgi:exonuclease SbcC
MRLLHLTFAGLGPFRDRQSIDFARLAESRLFLLEGPTGSGKSTVIDAIVFALYGNVAGTGSDGARVVSPSTRSTSGVTSRGCMASGSPTASPACLRRTS